MPELEQACSNRVLYRIVAILSSEGGGRWRGEGMSGSIGSYRLSRLNGRNATVVVFGGASVSQFRFCLPMVSEFIFIAYRETGLSVVP